ncbi:MAG: hypothetical protein JNK58_11210 [Phycisphaerae bacterium]|nr:hypothetical protein [Phycisphaerae bacterium]
MFKHAAVTLIAFGSGIGVAAAGPDWTEVGDAGKVNAQIVPFPVQPQFISGTLGDFPLALLDRGAVGGGNDSDGGPDVADVYEIQVEFNDEFIATTYDPSFTVTLEVEGDERTGSTNFDTALWVFRQDRRGLLGNNDISATNNRSRILPIATDGTGSRIAAPGRYLIAVSYGDVAPVSLGGLPLFSFSNNPGSTQVSGPDGAGGSNGFVAWSPNTLHPIRKYRISIRPTPCPAHCAGDANGDGVVSFLDITSVLAAWNSSCR